MRQEILLTGRSGTLHGRLWMGERRSRGVVIVIHGLGDHGGRYESIAEDFTQQGWSLFAFDLPGHGLSPGSRGRIDSFDTILSDIACARQTVGERLTNMPHVLLGHSMGGNLAINYALRRRAIEPSMDDLAGLILCAPMLLPPRPPPRPHIFAAWLTGHLFPWIRVRRPMNVSQLTSDSDQALAATTDPLRHSQISVYLATQLLSQGRWALDHARDIDVPTLVLDGDADELIDRSACENLAIRVGSLATHESFSQQRHDLLYDCRRDDVLASISRWLRQFVKSESAN